jgi:hypothetical protein
MYLAASVPLSFRCLLSVTAHTIYIHLILQEYSAYNYAIQATRQEPGIYTGACVWRRWFRCVPEFVPCCSHYTIHHLLASAIVSINIDPSCNVH